MQQCNSNSLSFAFYITDFAIKENELQMEQHIAEKDESDLIYQPFGDLSEAQLAEKGIPCN